MSNMNLKDALERSLLATKEYIDAELVEKANAEHGTHLTLGIGSSNAYRGDYGNTAYNHSQAAHAPSNAQKNSDITKSEIEAKLTGTVTSHNHNSITATTGSSWDGTAVPNSTDCLINFYSHISKSAAGLFTTGDNSNAIISINRHQGNYDSQLGFNSQGGIFYRFVDGTAMEDNTSWYKIYTSLNKPTPDEIGAAPASHGTHLTLGTGSSNAYYGDKGNTAYQHSQAAHAPSNAQKNSDITKTEIENKLTGTISSHMHDYITSMDTRDANSAPNTYTTRGIYPEFKATSTIGLPNVGKSFAGVVTYQQWSDTTSWSGGKATQFATIDDGRMYFRKGEGTSWGAWNQFYTNLHKPQLDELGAAPADHNHTSLTGVTNIAFASGSSDTASMGTTLSGDITYFDFNLTDDTNADAWRWRFGAWDTSTSSTKTFDAMTLKATSPTKSQLNVNGSITADSFNGLNFWTGTQAQYNGLSSKSNSTIYIIIG